jgi:hypothetical protein
VYFVVGVNAGIVVESGKMSTSDLEADVDMVVVRSSDSVESSNIEEGIPKNVGKLRPGSLFRCLCAPCRSH